MIKAVIFDIGGTIVDWTDYIIWRYVARKYHVNYSYAKKKLDYLSTFRELGSLEEKKMWKIFFESVNIPLPKDYKFLMSEKFEKLAKLNIGVIRLIKRLGKGGYKLGVISNIESTHERIVKKRGWLKYFDVVVLSNKVRIRKPSKEIYKIALKRLKVKPSEAIFIDNLKENVVGAKRVGIKSIWFKNATQLERKMKSCL